MHPSARLEAGVTVDPLAVIGPHAEIGAGTVIAAGAVIGPDVCIGRDCAIGAGATILHALIGDRVIIHPGARIGQDGFGYLPGPQGHRKSRRPAASSSRTTWRSAPIRPSTAARPATPSSARAPRSTIWSKSHTTCSIGRHCLIASQTGISGSVQGGRFRHDGRAGRRRRPYDDRRRRHARRAGRRHVPMFPPARAGRLSGPAGARVDAGVAMCAAWRAAPASPKGADE